MAFLSEGKSSGCFVWGGIVLILILAFFAFNIYQTSFIPIEDAPEIETIKVPRSSIESLLAKVDKAIEQIYAVDTSKTSIKANIVFDEDETNALLMIVAKNMITQISKNKKVDPILRRLIPLFGKDWSIVYQNREFVFMFNATAENMPEWTWIKEKKTLPLRLNFVPRENDDEFEIRITEAYLGRLPNISYIVNKFEDPMNDYINELLSQYDDVQKSIQVSINEIGHLEITYYPARLKKFVQYLNPEE